MKQQPLRITRTGDYLVKQYILKNQLTLFCISDYIKVSL